MIQILWSEKFAVFLRVLLNITFRLIDYFSIVTFFLKSACNNFSVVPEPKRQKVSAGVVRTSSVDSAPKKISSISSISNMIIDSTGKLTNVVSSGNKNQNKVQNLNAQPIMDAGLKRGKKMIIIRSHKRLMPAIGGVSLL